MKKFLAILLCAFCCVTLLTSCNSEHEHTYEWKFDELTHWQVATCTLNLCDFDMPAPAEHIDHNLDNICDVCNYELHHEHTGKYLMGETSHYYQYTCGCPSPDIAEMHTDYTGDGFCDVCGYQYTPTNHFLRDQAGCEWLYDISANDISKIKIISEYVGVEPGSFKYISTSTDKKVIERIFEAYYLLDTFPIPKENGLICGGGAYTIKFILKDGSEKIIYLNNGNYLDSNGNYFELLYIPKFSDSDEQFNCFGFITYQGTGIVRDGDNNQICEVLMDEFEFIALNEDISMQPTNYRYTVETEFGKLAFIQNDLFYMVYEHNRTYYKLVGKNLDEMIDYTLNQNQYFTLDFKHSNWLYEPLNNSYKAGETVSVKVSKAYDLGYLFLLNGEVIRDDYQENSDFWLFTFEMPSKNSVIEFKTYDGFLPHKNYGTLLENYLIKNNCMGAYVYMYLGEYASGAIVAMFGCSDCGYDDVVWSEKVGEFTFTYTNSNAIKVLYQKEFYTLTCAFENGYLTNADIDEILKLYDSYFKL